ncbi:MAG: MgtC/SapB family protein [Candidatus Liptonbacteria bacterium]|nr:MgtC/SapB family protein [Candidatus Liptonbacteria bacterium]
MLTFSQMLLRLVIALALGAIMGLEREMVGKDAGIRTTMLVAGGSAIFTMISISIPYLTQLSAIGAQNVLPDRVISNIVVGIGFLGAGIIIKTGEHVRGLTTAALVWTAAAVGTLVGLDFFAFATTSAFLFSGLLYITRRTGLSEKFNPKHRVPED